MLLWIPFNAIQYATVISAQNDTKLEKMKPKCATKQSSQIKSNRICCVSIYYQCAEVIYMGSTNVPSNLRRERRRAGGSIDRY